ncbi:hypothetical protein TCAL_00607 [Tigriopus californicus]|uniref:Ionotropic glutamate receptor L-glutamate and glycine-binding domain-containing protein n=2 Tax=Tigriopus californicus TaxID=6832 RepID=A0A553PBN7_TIGCA|nr:hypothetical protein TCAL_00607 [Tigriopus californicus]|eukprot:TCALIF_00607-PA protein Name:"Similar to Grid1 Glutamate receptor ionotropic, delta-1 (Mus musculus)" AED:0.12 eAED:0.12 QI:40/1/0/1/1/0/2/0/572
MANIIELHRSEFHVGECSTVIHDHNFDYQMSNIIMPIVVLSPSMDQRVVGSSIQACSVLILHIHNPVNFAKKFKHYIKVDKMMLIAVTDISQASDMTFRTFLRAIFIDAGGQEMWRRSSIFTNELISWNAANSIEPVELIKFDGVSIKSVAFHNPPFSRLNFKTGEHGGYEYRIAKGLVDAIGLKLTIFTPTDGERWGFEVPPKSGNFSGLLGEIMGGNADMAWANLFTEVYRMSFMDFTDWYNMDEVCFLVPRSRSYSKIFALIMPMDYFTWFGFLGSVVAFFLVFATFYYQEVGGWKREAENVMPFVTAIALNQSSPWTFKLRTQGLKCLTAVFLITMFVLLSGYSAALKTFLTINIYPTPVNTYDDLDTLVQTQNLKVSVCCSSIIDALRITTVESLQRVADRLVQPVRGSLNPFLNVSLGTHIIPQGRNKLEIAIRQQLTNKLGQTNVHIMDECFLSLPIAFGLKKDSPLKPMFDYKLRQLREAGLVEKWIADEISSFGKFEKSFGTRAREAEALTLYDLQGAFIVFLAALGFAIVALVLEWIWKLIDFHCTLRTQGNSLKPTEQTPT